MRSHFLDALRGLAIVWMVIFHACFDLRMWGFNSFDFSQGFWYVFPRIIAGTFLFCVGVSLNFTHGRGINWRALRERSIKLGSAAAVISIGTYFLFPSQWIYFGTLHCILVGSLLGAFFVARRRLALGALIMTLIGQYLLGYDIKWVSALLKRQSMDFIPIYPWIWVILLGLLLGPYLTKISALRNLPKIPVLGLLGQHSLKIYLLHQPILYGLIWAFSKLP